jgi:hypothetical protein
MSFDKDINNLLITAWEEENNNNKTQALITYNSALEKLSVFLY